MLVSASAARLKRTRRGFDIIADCIVTHEAKVQLTLVVNRRTRFVLVGKGKHSYAGNEKQSILQCCNQAPRLDTRVHGGALTAPSRAQG